MLVHQRVLESGIDSIKFKNYQFFEFSNVSDIFLETWEFTIFQWENLGLSRRPWGDCQQEIAQDADGKDFQPEDSGAETVSGSTEGKLRTDPCWLVSHRIHGAGIFTYMTGSFMG